MFDNLWELAKPIDTLIVKISDAIGVLYNPKHIENTAKAEGKAYQIKELWKLETSILKHRAMQRFIAEENKQAK